MLDPGVLGISQQYRADMISSTAAHANKNRRHDAYRQFVLWRHGRLGRGMRKVIQSCCVWAIRDVYPSPDGLYAGFKASRFV